MPVTREAQDERRKRVDALPAVEWTPLATALESLMSDLSEECWCAGWLVDTEYAVWDLMHGDLTSWGQGPFGTVEDAVAPIRAVAELAGLWIVWRDGPGQVAVDLDGWRAAVGVAGDETDR